jgi:transposase InsO family protein
MSAHEGEFTMIRMCQMLGVSASGYYAWHRRRPSRRAEANAALMEQIREIHRTSRRTYGSPRVHAALRRCGLACGRNRVARLMRREGLVGRSPRRRYPRTTQAASGNPVAPNVLAQDFTAERPDQKWVADITYVDTAEGWLYLAPVLDLFSRKVVGWSMDNHLYSSLVEDALHMAVIRRRPAPGLLHHSDRGSQYTSDAYQQRLAKLECEVSMSRTGNCYDNAVMESFFSTLKSECLTGQFRTRAQARTAIFEFIEVWYNRHRLHSSLGYLSPEEFEHSLVSDILTVH